MKFEMQILRFYLVGQSGAERQVNWSLHQLPFIITQLIISFLPAGIVDTTPPVITGCPDRMSYTVPNIGQSQIVSWTPPTAVDDSGQPPAITNTHSPGDSFSVGNTQVTYTFTDGSGNVAVCTFEIIVSGKWNLVVMGLINKTGVCKIGIGASKIETGESKIGTGISR